MMDNHRRIFCAINLIVPNRGRMLGTLRQLMAIAHADYAVQQEQFSKSGHCVLHRLRVAVASPPLDFATARSGAPCAEADLLAAAAAQGAKTLKEMGV